ncbi:hypothetical protein DIPPA_21039 [Diplonema papillatum]|nr:hypothetical protein DIPPA_21039 [Diplonema papillatum]
MSAAASLTFCKGFLLCLDGRPVPVVMHLACGDYIAAVIKIVPKPAFASLVEAAPGVVPAPLPTFPYYWNCFAQAVAKSIDENRNIRHAIRTLLNL